MPLSVKSSPCYQFEWLPFQSRPGLVFLSDLHQANTTHTRHHLPFTLEGWDWHSHFSPSAVTEPSLLWSGSMVPCGTAGIWTPKSQACGRAGKQTPQCLGRIALAAIRETGWKQQIWKTEEKDHCLHGWDMWKSRGGTVVMMVSLVRVWGSCWGKEHSLQG